MQRDYAQFERCKFRKNEERKRHKFQCVTELAECTGVTDLSLNGVVRLGKIIENRLLKVTVHTNAQKRALQSGVTKFESLLKISPTRKCSQHLNKPLKNEKRT